MIADDATGTDPDRPTARPRESAPLPSPHVARRRWTSWLIWLVPIIALAAVAYYGRHYLANRGPDVLVRLADVSMLQPGETPIRSRGVEIGRVVDVRLSEDRAGANVAVRLHRDAESFARQGATYWIVKPDLQGGSFRGLSTVLSGPYLEARPGIGDPQSSFVGLDGPPAASLRGLSVKLLARDISRVQRGTPIFYRGIAVGAVESATLAPDATHVVLTAIIETRFAALLRANSRFWSEPPADIRGNVFTGVEVELGSVAQLFSGRISFASPDDPLARPAMGGDRFVLHDEPKDEWKAWRPQIEILSTTRPSDQTARDGDADASP